MANKLLKRAPLVVIRSTEGAERNEYGAIADIDKHLAAGDLEPPTELWLLFEPSIGGKSSAKSGLKKRRLELERFVEPHVTASNTANSIIFKGRRLFLRWIENKQKSRLVWHAMWALQGIYLLEAAWERGDIDTVARMAYGFAEYDRDIAVAQLFGCPVGASPKRWLDARRRGKSKKGKTKLTNKEDIFIESAYANNRHRKDWLRAMTDELWDRHSIHVSEKTVSRRLTKLGITNKS